MSMARMINDMLWLAQATMEHSGQSLKLSMSEGATGVYRLSQRMGCGAAPL